MMMRIVLLFLFSGMLLCSAQVTNVEDVTVIRSVFGITAMPKCDTLPAKKVWCADKDCKPKLHVPFVRGIKSVLVFSLPADTTKTFPVMEDYYYSSTDSAKLTFNRLYFYAEAFGLNKAATTKGPAELQIIVFYRQRNLVRVIRLNENDTVKAERICRVLAAASEAFYIAANYKANRFLKVKGE